MGAKRKRSEAIWATREYENRNYCEVNGIQTSFVKLDRSFGEKKEGKEILYIFFGIHTANVVQLADRIEQRARLAAA